MDTLELHRLLGELQATIRTHAEEERERGRRIADLQAQLAELRAEIVTQRSLFARLDRVEAIAEDYRALKQRGWGAIVGAAIAGAGTSLGIATLWQRFILGH